MKLLANPRRVNCCLVLVPILTGLQAASASSFTAAEAQAIEAFIQSSIVESPAALVVGLVDETGERVFSVGSLNNGSSRKPDGESVFFVGSVSKTFTSLLLLEMANRGEVRLDDPVGKYLPASVTMPTFDGKEITLIDLATQSSGLPFNADNMTGGSPQEEYESYTVEKMYAFLERYKLDRQPGTQFRYSNVGMALLGHALEQRAGTSFESLVVERICRPLAMESTCITLTAEASRRLAIGRDAEGNQALPWKFQAYHPAGDIHSTANDLLSYAAAQAGLRRSSLTPLIEQSQVIRFNDSDRLPGDDHILMGRTATPWVDRNAVQPPGMELLAHAGGAGSYHAWVGFDKRQRRGVVVLSTANDLQVEAIGWTILQRLPLTEERQRDFAREMVGIGTALAIDDQAHALKITAVIPNSPAAEAGVPPESLIRAIDGMAIEGKSLGACVDLIRGPIGTKVSLEIVDPNDGRSRVIELTRRKFSS